ncbi:lysophospholipid acyltransferase family protein [Cyanobium sp. HWJ4-Hawea]|uniref:lysophospholipid acyltransferase family protein n=1 Tax=Cyanobium sp. HWJ4-Hawea TaxID=2823713 RepID=UPI0020CC676B|nr:lysophospholipid acyltransferase family protein [Cyanobium sp. HWJ4-Hawea]MCP9808380.1 lysophospholipid acyltransferase family protein [Cyanobium sp. HWJ4-Hawea]
MAKKRTLLNNRALTLLVGGLLNAYGQVVLLTSRLRIEADPELDLLVKSSGEPVIYALWHSHVFFVPLLRSYERRPVSVLLSAHRDAQIVGVAARLRGIRLVVGSSTRGGARAYLQLLRVLQQGQSVGITPDGPKGPRELVKPGVIHLAQQSGCAVVPVALACSRVHRLRSWDCTFLPLPFSRAVFVLGAPIYFSADAPIEALQDELNRAMESTVGRAQARITGPQPGLVGTSHG